MSVKKKLKKIGISSHIAKRHARQFTKTYCPKKHLICHFNFDFQSSLSYKFLKGVFETPCIIGNEKMLLKNK